MNPTVFIRLATAAVCGKMTIWPSVDKNIKALYTYIRIYVLYLRSCAGMYIHMYTSQSVLSCFKFAIYYRECLPCAVYMAKHQMPQVSEL